MKDIISANEIDLSRENDGYEGFLSSVRASFEKQIQGGDDPLFTTDATDLYETFLEELPAEARQHYNCNACRHFVNRFGGLVRIDGQGKTHPVMWSIEPPGFFIGAVDAIQKKVKAAKVTGVFINGEKYLGIRKTGSWTHMAVDMPKAMVYHNLLKTPYQMAAEKAEDFKMLTNAISKYSIETVETAVKLLRSDSLYRSEKVLGVAEWFMGVLNDRSGKRGKTATNIVWRKAATAPTGFCHVSSSMIGTLLDDIEAGYDFDEVSRRFSEKMNPLQYQRPQAAPSAGNVAQAEKIVAKLGIENSLKRRFARLDELQTLWLPRVESKSKPFGGVFSGVSTKQSAAKKTNNGLTTTVTMTWEKFKRTVLPEAQKIEFRVTGRNDSYSALVTAVDPDAPPIIQWDSEESRNPFNWYVYSGGSAPGNWGLSMGWAEVTGVVLQPSLWRPGFEHQGQSVFFILKGCKDHRYRYSGAALFPEVLKSELREVRSTIEAFSRKTVLEGYDEATACGIRCQASSKWWDYTFRVTTSLGVTEYKLDRWD